MMAEFNRDMAEMAIKGAMPATLAMVAVAEATLLSGVGFKTFGILNGMACAILGLRTENITNMCSILMRMNRIISNEYIVQEEKPKKQESKTYDEISFGHATPKPVLEA